MDFLYGLERQWDLELEGVVVRPGSKSSFSKTIENSQRIISFIHKIIVN